jgi:hypothetical protein
MTTNKPINFDTELAKFTDRQMEAIKHLDSGVIKYLLYGGALGGGKSYFLRWYGIRRLMDLAVMGFKNCTAMLACEDYPTLKDRQLSKIPREFPQAIGNMHQDHKEYGRCFILNPEYGSGVLCFRNLDDPSKYQSSEWVLILIDELTKNPFETFTDLRMRLRWPGLPDLECQFVGGTNPGGIGHGWVKQFWMDKIFAPEWVAPIDYRPHFAYVPSKADDNPHLDTAYWAMLNTLPENLRKAFRDGDWNIFVGQAFPEVNRETHAIKPIWPIPEHAPLYMTLDWGFGRPFSIGWWWMDEMRRAVRYDRWYGCSGVPNEGLRLPDSKIGEEIVKREVKMGFATLRDTDNYKSAFWNRPIIRYAGFDCFNKRPDYKGGGQGPTTAETLAQYGIIITPMDAKREVKIRQFREYLKVQTDGLPMMMVYETDEEFFRTIPNLVMDKNNIEDVDTDGEDHVYDEVCHICMARPIYMHVPEAPKTGPSLIVEEVENIYKEQRLPWEIEQGPGEPGFFEEERW